MNENKMNFDMKVGERLKVSKGYVEIYQVDRGIRYYSMEGKLLSKFSKEQLKKQHQPTCICMENCILIQKGNYWSSLTYAGVEICQFEATDLEVYENYVVVKNDKEMKLYDTERREFVGENFDKVWRWDELFVLKKDEMHYLYNVESKKIEEKFQICIWAEHKRGKNFIFLYYKDKCGLLIAEKNNEKFSRVLPIKYQKIKIKDDEIIAIKNGKKEHYPLEKSYCKEEKCYADTDNKNNDDYKINFLNSIKVSFGETVILNEKFILVLRDLKEERPCKYYTLNGKYIGDSGLIKNEFGEFRGESYIETENLLAIGGERVFPFGTAKDWKIYDYEGNPIFENTFEKVEKNGKYLICKQPYKSINKGLTLVLSDYGKVLCELEKSTVYLVRDKYFKVHDDNEGRIWIFDDKGKKLFNRSFCINNSVSCGDFIFEEIENGYNIYDCNHGSYYYAKFDSLEEMDKLHELKIFKAIYKGKQGVILLNSKGYEIIVPVEYLDVKKKDKIILAKAEEWDDIYSLDGTLIMSTK